MNRRSILLSILLLAALPASAHKLRVFATAEGALIQGQVYFAGGPPAAGARVRVEDANGQLLAAPVPDGDGAFSYRAVALADHLLIAETGDGHRVRWRVPAAELVAGFPGAALGAGQEPDGHGIDQGPVPGADLDPTLLAALEQAVARQVRPLREEMNAARDRLVLRDVLGGIGYIVGVAGLLAWWRSRRGGGTR